MRTSSLPAAAGTRLVLATGLLLPALPLALHGQRAEPTRVTRGLAIGDVPRVSGIRLNYRDRALERVDGVHVTIWSPYAEPPTGTVRGLALGLPVTATGDISGAAIGVLGVGAGRSMRGLGVGLAGVGAGGSLEGIMLGGLGVGTGGSARGITIGGLGAGVGGSARGLMLAPAVFRIENGGSLRGASASAVNLIRGEQRGLAIGIVNYAHRLHGVQLGVINIVRDNPSGRRVLPVVNWGRRD